MKVRKCADMQSACCFFSVSRPINFNFLNSENTRLPKYCQEITKINIKSLHRSFNRKALIILHANAWQHVSLMTLQMLREFGYEVFPHQIFAQIFLPLYVSSTVMAFCRRKISETKMTLTVQRVISTKTPDIYITEKNNNNGLVSL